MKRFVAVLLIGLLLFSLTASAEKTRARWARAFKHGNRDEARVSITIDDWIHPEMIPQFLEVAEKYGVKLTLYPSGYLLKPADRALWQSVLDAGHEIGCHFFQHKRLTERSQSMVARDLQKYEKALDETLGYHYEFLTVRPPYGAGMAQGGGGTVGRWIHNAGFDNIVLWDMDNTKDLKKALRIIQNGSIILIHANKHDLWFFGELMEALKDRNYEYVTISELLHLDSRYYYKDE